MTTRDKYIEIFGSISSLTEEIPWTTGLSNMFEYNVWDTKSVLGISKTEMSRLIVRITDDTEFKTLEDNAREKYIKKKLEELQKLVEGESKHSKPLSGYCSAREALRRAKYFSEDYLNKEFDIFLNLCSDKYLDYIYSNYINIECGGHWSTHGNSEYFAYSTNIIKVQMDNLAYNIDKSVLVANELKLGGRKNKDQLLKYSYLYNELVENKFISPTSIYMLLFISDKKKEYEVEEELEKEIEYCKHNINKHYLLEENLMDISKMMLVKSMTWSELKSFNENYMNSLHEENQVEIKLLRGFNETLNDKAYLQNK